MYEVDKIKEMIEQTQKQKDLILKAQDLEESMKAIRKTIALYDTFVVEAEAKLAASSSEEDRKALNDLKETIDDFVDLLKKQQRDFVEIKNNFRFVTEKNYDERLEYIKNLIKFQDISQKLKLIEKQSKKLQSKCDKSSFVTLISAEGRKKSIYNADVYEYENLTNQKKNLNNILKKQYMEVLRNYEAELNKKASYVETTERVNLIEPIENVETNNINKTLNSFSTYNSQNVNPDEWLQAKAKFKTYLLDDLHIKDIHKVNELLNLYNEGLQYNIDFKMTLFSMGYPQDAIDFIVNRFDRGPKPKGVEDNLAIRFYEARIFDNINNDVPEQNLDESPIETPKNLPKKKGKLISFIKKKITEPSKKIIKNNLEKVTSFIAVGLMVATWASTDRKQSLSSKIEDFIDNALSYIQDENLNQQITSEVACRNLVIENDIVEQENVNNDLFAEYFTVNAEANIYNNMYDAYYNNNQIEPYYNNSTSRKVKAIIMAIDDQLIYVTNQKDYEKYLMKGAIPNSILATIDGFTEGFYSFNDTSIAGKGYTKC